MKMRFQLCTAVLGVQCLSVGLYADDVHRLKRVPIAHRSTLKLWSGVVGGGMGATASGIAVVADRCFNNDDSSLESILAIASGVFVATWYATYKRFDHMSYEYAEEQLEAFVGEAKKRVEDANVSAILDEMKRRDISIDQGRDAVEKALEQLYAAREDLTLLDEKSKRAQNIKQSIDELIDTFCDILSEFAQYHDEQRRLRQDLLDEVGDMLSAEDLDEYVHKAAEQFGD